MRISSIGVNTNYYTKKNAVPKQVQKNNITQNNLNFGKYRDAETEQKMKDYILVCARDFAVYGHTIVPEVWLKELKKTPYLEVYTDEKTGKVKGKFIPSEDEAAQRFYENVVKWHTKKLEDLTYDDNGLHTVWAIDEFAEEERIRQLPPEEQKEAREKFFGTSKNSTDDEYIESPHEAMLAKVYELLF